MQQANRKKRHHQLRSKNFSKAKTNKAPSKVASGLGGISRCAGSMPMQLKGPAVSLIVVAKKQKKKTIKLPSVFSRRRLFLPPLPFPVRVRILPLTLSLSLCLSVSLSLSLSILAIRGCGCGRSNVAFRRPTDCEFSPTRVAGQATTCRRRHPPTGHHRPPRLVTAAVLPVLPTTACTTGATKTPTPTPTSLTT